MLCRVAVWESLDISSPLIGGHEVAKETGLKFVLQNSPMVQYATKPTQSHKRHVQP